MQHIAVFMKPVPDNTRLALDDYDAPGIPQDGVDLMLNPYDEYALETALRLKAASEGDVTITVIALGSPVAKALLKKMIAVGADQAMLLSAPAFLQGDSTTRARLFAQLATTLTPTPADMLLFGESSLDVAAGQTGPMVAELLDWPSLTACKDAEVIDANTIKACQVRPEGLAWVQLDGPGVLCLQKCDYELRSANIKGVMRANKATIMEKTPEELGLSADAVGMTAAPTEITRVFSLPKKAAGTKIDGADPQQAAAALIEFLKSRHLVG